MSPLLAVALLACGVRVTVSSLRLTGAAGRERLSRLASARARAVHALSRSRMVSILTGLNVVNAVIGGILWLVLGSATASALSWGAAVAMVAGVVAAERARPDVMAAFDALGLDALPTETSSRRWRTLWRLGIAVTVGLAVGQVVSVIQPRHESLALGVLGVVAFAVMIIGTFWFVIALAWRYGDETTV